MLNFFKRFHQPLSKEDRIKNRIRQLRRRKQWKLRRGRVDALAEYEIDILTKELAEYYNKRAKEEQQEKEFFLAALAELDGEIPRS